MLNNLRSSKKLEESSMLMFLRLRNGVLILVVVLLLRIQWEMLPKLYADVVIHIVLDAEESLIFQSIACFCKIGSK